MDGDDCITGVLMRLIRFCSIGLASQGLGGSSGRPKELDRVSAPILGFGTGVCEAAGWAGVQPLGIPLGVYWLHLTRPLQTET